MELQLLIAIVGWAFVYDISHRALKRAEISRFKDSVVAKTEELVAWYSNEAKSDTPLSTPQLEASFTGRVFHLRQKLENYCSITKIAPQPLFEHINKIHGFPVEFDRNNISVRLDNVHNLSELTFDFIQDIEDKYNVYINQKFTESLIESLPISLGILAGSTALLCSFHLLSFLLSPLIK